MKLIKCDCGHKCHPTRGQPVPFITGKGGTKSYIICKRCKKVMIIYKQKDGNFTRSKVRERQEKESALTPNLRWYFLRG